jgi:hypothetical protein
MGEIGALVVGPRTCGGGGSSADRASTPRRLRIAGRNGAEVLAPAEVENRLLKEISDAPERLPAPSGVGPALRIIIAEEADAAEAEEQAHRDIPRYAAASVRIGPRWSALGDALPAAWPHFAIKSSRSARIDVGARRGRWRGSRAAAGS